MAITSRGRMAGMARAMSQLQTAHQLLIRDLERAVQDPSERTDDAGETVEALLKDAPTTLLAAADFAAGTLRIRQSGRYLLTEDVDFDPPAEPSGENYPSPPYQLGFFAAITIEAENVVIDLGGHTIRQSKRHALRQRFFSVIELSDQPFLRGQGPSDFGPDDPGGSTMCLITNGRIGRSAHHGIHGSGPNNDLFLKNVVITDFEVAGVHISNPKRCTLQNCHIARTRSDVPVRATYSHAIFARNALRRVDLTHRWRGKSGADLLAEIELAIQQTENEVLSGNAVTNALFRNDTGLLDGNCYGVVVHKRGVVIGPLTSETRTGTSVFMVDVCIEDIVSAPQKTTVFSAASSDAGGAETYGAVGQVVRGPVGDAIDLVSVGAPGAYTPTVLSDVQMYLAKHAGKGNIPSRVLDWASGTTTFPADTLYERSGLDSMAHTMKGNIGLFLSGIETVVADRIRVDGVHNRGNIGESPGDAAVGMLATACSKLVIRDSTVLDTNTCGAEFRHGTRASLKSVTIAKTSVPVLKDGDSSIHNTGGAHATLLAR